METHGSPARLGAILDGGFSWNQACWQEILAWGHSIVVRKGKAITTSLAYSEHCRVFNARSSRGLVVLCGREVNFFEGDQSRFVTQFVVHKEENEHGQAHIGHGNALPIEIALQNQFGVLTNDDQ